MEIERKFTIKKLPENISGYAFHVIEQAYLNTDPVIRIRREDDRYYMTYKGKGFMAREEYNLPLNAESYAHLLPKADGNVISKKRYLIPLDPSCCRAGAPANTLASSDAHSNASTDASMQTSPDPIDSFQSSRPKASDTASLSPQDTPTDAWTPVVELDLFAAPFDGLIIAEVEFPSIEAANSFVPPSWFDEDVTSDPAYHNSNLSRLTV